jgi:hypothetical protein
MQHAWRRVQAPPWHQSLLRALHEDTTTASKPLPEKPSNLLFKTPEKKKHKQ